MITWHFVKVDFSSDEDTVSLVIQEGVDGIPIPDKTYASDPLPRTTTGIKARVLADLKAKVLSERAHISKKEAVEAFVDLTNFETFVNS
jgi:hypothetical protein